MNDFLMIFLSLCKRHMLSLNDDDKKKLADHYRSGGKGSKNPRRKFYKEEETASGLKINIRHVSKVPNTQTSATVFNKLLLLFANGERERQRR